MSRFLPYLELKKTNLDYLSEAPAHWVEMQLCRAASCNDEAVPEDLNGEKIIRYVDISSVSHIEGITQATEMRFSDAPSRARRTARVGDVVVSTVRTYLKAVAQVTHDYRDCVYSTGFAVLRARPTAVHPDYLKWLMLNELLIQSVEAHSEGLSYPAINASALVKLKTVVPPIGEQLQISSFLERKTARIDTLIAKKTRFIELLKEKRQAVITKAVTKGLDPDVKLNDSGVEWIGSIPAGWKVAPIKYVAKLESGHTPSRSVSAYWENCTVPWFTLADIWQVRKAGRSVITETSEMVSELGLANSSARKLPAGTVVLSRTASVGFPAILGTEMATSQDFAAWICRDGLHNEYLYFCLVAMRSELGRLMMGSTHKTIYMPDIEQFRCPLPPIDEQKAIAFGLWKQTERIDSLVAKTQRSIELLKEHRAALITAAVTGKIDVREAA